MVKKSSKTKITRSKHVNIYPYRVLYLVVGIAVLSLVLLIQLALSN